MTDSFLWIEEVKTTLPSLAAAEQLAAALVENRLVACVQIIGPIKSVYRWQGVVNNDTEFSISCKTVASKLAALIDHIHAVHPYELPEILCSRWQATPAYANWVSEQVC